MRRSDAELQTEAQSLLLRVRKSPQPKRKIKPYEIFEIPDVALHGLRHQTQSKKIKATKIENFYNAIDNIRRSGGLQLFARRRKPNESPRLDVDAEKLTTMASNPLIYGSRSEWRDAFSIRCDRVEAENPDHSAGAPAAPRREQTTPREVANVEMIRIFRPTAYSEEQDPAIIDGIMNTSVTATRDHDYSRTPSPYSNATAYGLKYGRSTAAQRLSRNARNADLEHAESIWHGELPSGAACKDAARGTQHRRGRDRPHTDKVPYTDEGRNALYGVAGVPSSVPRRR